MIQRRLDAFVAAGLVVFSIWGYIRACSLPDDAGDFPKITFSILFLASATIVADCWRRRHKSSLSMRAVNIKRVSFISVFFLAMIISLSSVGFPLAGFVFLAISQLALSSNPIATRSVAGAVTIATFVMLGITVFFLILLRVSLPWGMLDAISI